MIAAQIVQIAEINKGPLSGTFLFKKIFLSQGYV